jgi:hypothetical protein
MDEIQIDPVLSQDVLFDTGKDPVIEWMDPWDPRLPQNLERPAGQDFKNMCKSMRSGQIYSIAVGRWVPCDGEPEPPFEYHFDGYYRWALADGRQRTAACRENKLQVRAEIYDVFDASGIIQLRETANFIRSANEAADVRAIMDGVMLEGKNYDEVIIGMPKQEAIRLHKKWQDVPREYLDGVVDGICSTGTAQEVKKLKGQAKQNAIQLLQEARVSGERVTSKDIKELRSAVKQAAVDQGMSWLPTKESVGRTSFGREELEWLQSLLPRNKQTEKAHQYLEELLG